MRVVTKLTFRWKANERAVAASYLTNKGGRSIVFFKPDQV